MLCLARHLDLLNKLPPIELSRQPFRSTGDSMSSEQQITIENAVDRYWIKENSEVKLDFDFDQLETFYYQLQKVVSAARNERMDREIARLVKKLHEVRPS